MNTVSNLVPCFCSPPDLRRLLHLHDVVTTRTPGIFLTLHPGPTSTRVNPDSIDVPALCLIFRGERGSGRMEKYSEPKEWSDHLHGLVLITEIRTEFLS